MSLDEGLSRFIGRLYEAVYDEDDWHRALGELLALTGAHHLLMTFADLKHREFSKTFFFGPETSAFADAAREYDEGMWKIDASFAWACEHPYAGLCDTADLIPKNEYLSHPMIVWNRSRMGSTHWVVAYTPTVDDLSFSLSLHPPADVGPVSPRMRALLRLVFDHMERALRIAARPPDFSRDSGAIIALDRHARIIAMSPRAEELIAMADGLTLESRQVVASSGESTARLQQAIETTISAHLGSRPGGGVRLGRPSGKPDWLAFLSPYPRFLEHLPIPTPAAVLRVVEPESCPELSEEDAAAFDLTPRELDVARQLLRGHSLESLSNDIGISRNTARVHVQSLFRKTETHRQADLVRLLSEVARH